MTELAATCGLKGLEHRWFVMHAIRNHQLCTSAFRCGDDPFAVFDGGCHWLLEKQMDTRIQCAHGEIDVVPVGSSEVYRIDRAGVQQPVVLVVTVEVFDAVLFTNLRGLVLMSADEGNYFAVAGVFDPWQESGLRDPSDSDDSVANFAIADDNCVRHARTPPDAMRLRVGCDAAEDGGFRNA